MPGQRPDKRENLILLTDYKQVFFIVLGNVVGFDQALVNIKNPRRGFSGANYEVAFTKCLLSAVQPEKFHKLGCLFQGSQHMIIMLQRNKYVNFLGKTRTSRDYEVICDKNRKFLVRIFT